MSKEFLEFCETLHLNPTEELWEAYVEAEVGLEHR